MTIVNHKYKFIFIKTQKTAGTSMEISLSKFCNDKDIVSTIKPTDETLRKKLNFQGPTNHAYLNTDYLLNFKGFWLFLKNLLKLIPLSKKIFKYKDEAVLKKFKVIAPRQKLLEHNTLADLKKKFQKTNLITIINFALYVTHMTP